MSAFYGKDFDHVLEPGEIMVAYGHARRGFEYPFIKFAIITETDIFGKEQKKRKKKKNTMENVFRISRTFDWRLL